MKKILSILMAIVVLLSSFQLTVAGHFCSGQLAEFNIGIESELGCGMEHEKASFPQLENKCCHNFSQVLKVDKYQFSIVKHLIYKVELLSLLSLTAVPTLKNSESLINFVTTIKKGPPIKLLPLSERLASICVYLK